MNKSDYGNYLQQCSQCLVDDNIFNNFKSNHTYRIILEHLTPQLAIQYLNKMEQKYNMYFSQIDWNEISKNDMIGNPYVYNFDILSKYTKNTNFSPTTIRYVVTGLDILTSFKNNNPEKKEIKIIEVGGGYGGQCKILFYLSKLFDIKIKMYTIMDYEIVCQLQNKYLNKSGHTNFNFIYFDEKRKIKIQEYDLFISNYALGEICREYQDYYIKRIISNVKNVYIIWNMTELHPFFNNEKYQIKEEEPQTGTDNKIVINKY